MKVIKWLLFLVIFLIVAFVVVSMVLPKDYVVEKSVVIDAPSASIHPHIDDMKAWPNWMTWWQMDDTIKTTYEDPAKGVGAKSSWKSKKDGSAGEATITASDPNTGVKYDMAFIMGEGDAALRADSKTTLAFVKEGEGTRVTWRMEGDMPGFWGGWLKIAVSASAGVEFEKGLGRLKTLVEGS